MTTTDLAAPVRTGRDLEPLLRHRLDRLAGALEGTGITAERYIAGVVQAVAKDDRLLKCTRESVLMACLESAQIGLEPTGLLNQAWLVAYKQTARLMIGYSGYITLLDRSGQYDFIEANLVYEHDEFWWTKGTDPKIHHVPAPAGERGKFGHPNGAAYYVIWKKGSSRPKFDVMSMADLDKRRKVSQRAEQDMWRDWPEEMYRKTVLRWGLKTAALTPIIQRALAYEEQNYGMAEHVPVQAAQDTSRRDRLLGRISGSDGEATDGHSDPAEGTDTQNESEPAERPSREPGTPCSCEPGPSGEPGDLLVDADCPVHGAQSRRANRKSR